jgi:hypothetical protein
VCYCVACAAVLNQAVNSCRRHCVTQTCSCFGSNTGFVILVVLLVCTTGLHLFVHWFCTSGGAPAGVHWAQPS